ncbi:hypothetical protein F2Q70_00038314 [Brassica cretica]|uniref:Uncharacterized protein n=1 Tax=Brassica cretica TaxID=69181 RepID=A0A8S9MNW4_BRACR|nr:hypothetical protein F2Q70_00038314 [Brassica cretica]KAF2620772.1 hypothetical protein F2Q68_00038894 [Brassica cretica]
MVVENFSSESKVSSENSEGIPRIKDSEDIPKKHFLGMFVGISSDISDGTVLGNIPREKRYRNIPTNFGRRNIPRNFCRRSILRKCICRDIPRSYALGIFRGTTAVGIFRETFAVGIFRRSVSVGIFRGDMPSEYSEEVVVGISRGIHFLGIFPKIFFFLN